MTLGQDLRSAIRMMMRTPGFAAAAIATLALGLGLNSAALSVAYALFLKPLPLDDPSRLVIVDQTVPNRSPLSGFGPSYPDYVYYRDHARTFADLAAHYSTSPMHVATREASVGVTGSVVTASYFGTLRLQPSAGRFFTVDEDQVPGRDAVAVISHDLWRNQLGSDPRVLGTELRINGTAFTIIGIAPEGFRGVVPGVTPTDVWIPTAMFKVGYRYCDALARGCSVINVIGRLQAQATIQEAQAEMTLLARQLETAFPDTNKGRGILVRAARGVRIQEQTQSASIVALLAGAAALVLLVASANVAGLLLARGLRRRKEIAIRMALGASRGRLVRQLVVESIVLAIAGGVAGLIVALWSTEVLRGFFGVGYSGDALNVDLSLVSVRIVSAGLAIAIVTGLLTGIAPALQATRRDALPALKDETGGATVRRSRLRDGLIVLQLAVSVLLLAGSGLLVRSFLVVHRGPGFDPDALAMTRLRPSLVGYTNERAWAFQREVLRRIDAIPGVIAASPGNVPPLPGWGRPARSIQLAGDTTDRAQAFRASTTNVGSRYFTALGGRVLDGREFDDRDTPRSPRVAVINEALSRRLWPQGHAVGSRVTIGAADAAGAAYEIVGVVNDVQFVSVFGQPEPIAYLNYWQQDRRENWSSDSQTIVRVVGNASAMLPQIRAAIAAVDPDVPLSAPESLGARLDFAFSDLRGARMLLVTFGGLALIVSAIGLYAALAFAVGQRTREIAVRIAFGAARGDVARLVFRHGGAMVLIGTIGGLVGSVFAGPILSHLLYGVSPYDPVALLIGPLLLTAVACLAIWLPARRAMTVDPISVLRSE